MSQFSASAKDGKQLPPMASYTHGDSFEENPSSRVNTQRVGVSQRSSQSSSSLTRTDTLTGATMSSRNLHNHHNKPYTDAPNRTTQLSPVANANSSTTRIPPRQVSTLPPIPASMRSHLDNVPRKPLAASSQHTDPYSMAPSPNEVTPLSMPPALVASAHQSMMSPRPTPFADTHPKALAAASRIGILAPVSKKVPTALFLLGGPGAGVRTQARMLCVEYSLTHISMLDLFLAEWTTGSPAGRTIAQALCLPPTPQPGMYSPEGQTIIPGILPPEVSSAASLARTLTPSVTCQPVSPHIAVCLLQNVLEYHARRGRTDFLITGFPLSIPDWEAWSVALGDYCQVAGVLWLDCPLSIQRDRLLSEASNARSDVSSSVMLTVCSDARESDCLEKMKETVTCVCAPVPALQGNSDNEDHSQEFPLANTIPNHNSQGNALTYTNTLRSSNSSMLTLHGSAKYQLNILLPESLVTQSCVTFSQYTLDLRDLLIAAGRIRLIDATIAPTSVHRAVLAHMHPFAHVAKKRSVSDGVSSWSAGRQPTVVLLMGGPGAGVTTMVERILYKYRFTDIDVPALIRMAQGEDEAQNSGKTARKEGNSGKNKKNLTADAVCGLLQDHMQLLMRQHSKSHFLIRGFPHNITTYNAFTSILGPSIDLKLILFLDCPEHIRRQRLIAAEAETTPFSETRLQHTAAQRYLSANTTKKSMYGTTANALVDSRSKAPALTPQQAEARIAPRLQKFLTQTSPMLSEMAHSGVLMTIDAAKPLEQVWTSVDNTLKQHIPGVRNFAFAPISIINPHVARANEAKALPEEFRDVQHLDARSRALVVWLLGGPGSGRRQMAARLCRDYHIHPISVHELHLRAARKGTVEQREVALKCLSDGSLPPASLTARLIKEEILSQMRSFGRKSFLVIGTPERLEDVDCWQLEVSSVAHVSHAIHLTANSKVRVERRMAELRGRQGKGGWHGSTLLAAASAGTLTVPADANTGTGVGVTPPVSTTHASQQNNNAVVDVEAAKVLRVEMARYTATTIPLIKEVLAHEPGCLQPSFFANTCAVLPPAAGYCEPNTGKPLGFGLIEIPSDTVSEAETYAAVKASFTHLRLLSTEYRIRMDAFTRPARPLVILVLGPPGSGRRTVTEYISHHYAVELLDADQILEEACRTNTADGNLIQYLQKTGQAVPAETVVSQMQHALETHVASGKRFFLMSGFPRASGDWEAWQASVGNRVDVAAVLTLDCPADVCEKRLMAKYDTLTNNANNNANTGTGTSVGVSGDEEKYDGIIDTAALKNSANMQLINTNASSASSTAACSAFASTSLPSSDSKAVTNPSTAANTTTFISTPTSSAGSSSPWPLTTPTDIARTRKYLIAAAEPILRAFADSKHVHVAEYEWQGKKCVTEAPPVDVIRILNTNTSKQKMLATLALLFADFHWLLRSGIAARAAIAANHLTNRVIQHRLLQIEAQEEEIRQKEKELKEYLEDSNSENPDLESTEIPEIASPEVPRLVHIPADNGEAGVAHVLLMCGAPGSGADHNAIMLTQLYDVSWIGVDALVRQFAYNDNNDALALPSHLLLSNSDDGNIIAGQASLQAQLRESVRAALKQGYGINPHLAMALVRNRIRYLRDQQGVKRFVVTGLPLSISASVNGLENNSGGGNGGTSDNASDNNDESAATWQLWLSEIDEPGIVLRGVICLDIPVCVLKQRLEHSENIAAAQREQMEMNGDTDTSAIITAKLSLLKQSIIPQLSSLPHSLYQQYDPAYASAYATHTAEKQPHEHQDITLDSTSPMAPFRFTRVTSATPCGASQMHRVLEFVKKIFQQELLTDHSMTLPHAATVKLPPRPSPRQDEEDMRRALLLMQEDNLAETDEDNAQTQALSRLLGRDIVHKGRVQQSSNTIHLLHGVGSSFAAKVLPLPLPHQPSGSVAVSSGDSSVEPLLQILLLAGGPGSGRKALGEALQATYDMLFIDVEELVRQNALSVNASPQSKVLIPHLADGVLPPAEIVVHIVLSALKEARKQRHYHICLRAFPDSPLALTLWEKLIAPIAHVVSCVYVDTPLSTRQARVRAEWQANTGLPIQEGIILDNNDDGVENTVETGPIQYPGPEDPRWRGYAATPDALATKHTQFEQLTVPVISELARRGLVVKVNGEETLPRIISNVQGALAKVNYRISLPECMREAGLVAQDLITPLPHLCVWVVGPRGSGKSSIVAHLSELFHIHHVDVAQLILKEMASGSPFGRIFERAQAAGAELPAPMVVDVVRRHVAELIMGMGAAYRSFYFDHVSPWMSLSVPQLEGEINNGHNGRGGIGNAGIGAGPTANKTPNTATATDSNGVARGSLRGNTKGNAATNSAGTGNSGLHTTASSLLSQQQQEQRQEAAMKALHQLKAPVFLIDSLPMSQATFEATQLLFGRDGSDPVVLNIVASREKCRVNIARAQATAESDNAFPIDEHTLKRNEEGAKLILQAAESSSCGGFARTVMIDDADPLETAIMVRVRVALEELLGSVMLLNPRAIAALVVHAMEKQARFKTNPTVSFATHDISAVEALGKGLISGKTTAISLADPYTTSHLRTVASAHHASMQTLQAQGQVLSEHRARLLREQSALQSQLQAMESALHNVMQVLQSPWHAGVIARHAKEMGSDPITAVFQRNSGLHYANDDGNSKMTGKEGSNILLRSRTSTSSTSNEPFSAPTASILPIFLVGPPNAGKTTVASTIALNTNTVHLDVSLLLHMESKRQTPHSSILADFARVGKRAPAGIVLAVLRSHIEAYVLQGYNTFLIEHFPVNVEEWCAWARWFGSGDEEVFLLLAQYATVTAAMTGKDGKLLLSGPGISANSGIETNSQRVRARALLKQAEAAANAITALTTHFIVMDTTPTIASERNIRQSANAVSQTHGSVSAPLTPLQMEQLFHTYKQQTLPLIKAAASIFGRAAGCTVSVVDGREERFSAEAAVLAIISSLTFHVQVQLAQTSRNGKALAITDSNATSNTTTTANLANNSNINANTNVAPGANAAAGGSSTSTHINSSTSDPTTFSPSLSCSPSPAPYTNTHTNNTSVPITVLPIFLLGGPGSGKTALATKLSQILGIHHIDPTSLLEAEAHSRSRLSGKIMECARSGAMVPGEIVAGLVLRAVLHSVEVQKKGVVIISGFPTCSESWTAWKQAVGDNNNYNTNSNTNTNSSSNNGGATASGSSSGNVTIAPSILGLYLDCPRDIRIRRLVRQEEQIGAMKGSRSSRANANNIALPSSLSARMGFGRESGLSYIRGASVAIEKATWNYEHTTVYVEHALQHAPQAYIQSLSSAETLEAVAARAMHWLARVLTQVNAASPLALALSSSSINNASGSMPVSMSTALPKSSFALTNTNTLASQHLSPLGPHYPAPMPPLSALAPAYALLRSHINNLLISSAVNPSVATHALTYTPSKGPAGALRAALVAADLLRYNPTNNAQINANTGYSSGSRFGMESLSPAVRAYIQQAQHASIHHELTNTASTHTLSPTGTCLTHIIGPPGSHQHALALLLAQRFEVAVIDGRAVVEAHARKELAKAASEAIGLLPPSARTSAANTDANSGINANTNSSGNGSVNTGSECSVLAGVPPASIGIASGNEAEALVKGIPMGAVSPSAITPLILAEIDKVEREQGKKHIIITNFPASTAQWTTWTRKIKVRASIRGVIATDATAERCTEVMLAAGIEPNRCVQLLQDYNVNTLPLLTSLTQVHRTKADASTAPSLPASRLAHLPSHAFFCPANTTAGPEAPLAFLLPPFASTGAKRIFNAPTDVPRITGRAALDAQLIRLRREPLVVFVMGGAGSGAVDLVSRFLRTAAQQSVLKDIPALADAAIVSVDVTALLRAESAKDTETGMLLRHCLARAQPIAPVIVAGLLKAFLWEHHTQSLLMPDRLLPDSSLSSLSSSVGLGANATQTEVQSVAREMAHVRVIYIVGGYPADVESIEAWKRANRGNMGSGDAHTSNEEDKSTSSFASSMLSVWLHVPERHRMARLLQRGEPVPAILAKTARYNTHYEAALRLMRSEGVAASVYSDRLNVSLPTQSVQATRLPDTNTGANAGQEEGTMVDAEAMMPYFVHALMSVLRASIAQRTLALQNMLARSDALVHAPSNAETAKWRMLVLLGSDMVVLDAIALHLMAHFHCSYLSLPSLLALNRLPPSTTPLDAASLLYHTMQHHTQYDGVSHFIVSGFPRSPEDWMAWERLVAGTVTTQAVLVHGLLPPKVAQMGGVRPQTVQQGRVGETATQTHNSTNSTNISGNDGSDNNDTTSTSTSTSSISTVPTSASKAQLVELARVLNSTNVSLTPLHAPPIMRSPPFTATSVYSDASSSLTTMMASAPSSLTHADSTCLYTASAHDQWWVQTALLAENIILDLHLRHVWSGAPRRADTTPAMAAAEALTSTSTSSPFPSLGTQIRLPRHTVMLLSMRGNAKDLLHEEARRLVRTHHFMLVHLPAVRAYLRTLSCVQVALHEWNQKIMSLASTAAHTIAKRQGKTIPVITTHQRSLSPPDMALMALRQTQNGGILAEAVFADDVSSVALPSAAALLDGVLEEAGLAHLSELRAAAVQLASPLSNDANVIEIEAQALCLWLLWYIQLSTPNAHCAVTTRLAPSNSLCARVLVTGEFPLRSEWRAWKSLVWGEDEGSINDVDSSAGITVNSNTSSTPTASAHTATAITTTSAGAGPGAVALPSSALSQSIFIVDINARTHVAHARAAAKGILVDMSSPSDLYALPSDPTHPRAPLSWAPTSTHAPAGLHHYSVQVSADTTSSAVGLGVDAWLGEIATAFGSGAAAITGVNTTTTHASINTTATGTPANTANNSNNTYSHYDRASPFPSPSSSSTSSSASTSSLYPVTVAIGDREIPVPLSPSPVTSPRQPAPFPARTHALPGPPSAPPLAWSHTTLTSVAAEWPLQTLQPRAPTVEGLLFLVGPPGSGVRAVCSHLSSAYDICWLDLPTLIHRACVANPEGAIAAAAKRVLAMHSLNLAEEQEKTNVDNFVITPFNVAITIPGLPPSISVSVMQNAINAEANATSFGVPASSSFHTGRRWFVISGFPPSIASWAAWRASPLARTVAWTRILQLDANPLHSALAVYPKLLKAAKEDAFRSAQEAKERNKVEAHSKLHALQMTLRDTHASAQPLLRSAAVAWLRAQEKQCREQMLALQARVAVEEAAAAAAAREAEEMEEREHVSAGADVLAQRARSIVSFEVSCSHVPAFTDMSSSTDTSTDTPPPTSARAPTELILRMHRVSSDGTLGPALAQVTTTAGSHPSFPSPVPVTLPLANTLAATQTQVQNQARRLANADANAVNANANANNTEAATATDLAPTTATASDLKTSPKAADAASASILAATEALLRADLAQMYAFTLTYASTDKDVGAAGGVGSVTVGSPCCVASASASDLVSCVASGGLLIPMRVMANGNGVAANGSGTDARTTSSSSLRPTQLLLAPSRVQPAEEIHTTVQQRAAALTAAAKQLRETYQGHVDALEKQSQRLREDAETLLSGGEIPQLFHELLVKCNVKSGVGHAANTATAVTHGTHATTTATAATTTASPATTASSTSSKPHERTLSDAVDPAAAMADTTVRMCLRAYQATLARGNVGADALAALEAEVKRLDTEAANAQMVERESDHASSSVGAYPLNAERVLELLPPNERVLVLDYQQHCLPLCLLLRGRTQRSELETDMKDDTVPLQHVLASVSDEELGIGEDVCVCVEVKGDRAALLKTVDTQLQQLVPHLQHLRTSLAHAHTSTHTSGMTAGNNAFAASLEAAEPAGMSIDVDVADVEKTAEDDTKDTTTKANTAQENNIAEVHFLIGGPGSGKTSVCNALKERIDDLVILHGPTIAAADAIGDVVRNTEPSEETDRLMLRSILRRAAAYHAQGHRRFLVTGFPQSPGGWAEIGRDPCIMRGSSGQRDGGAGGDASGRYRGGALMFSVVSAIILQVSNNTSLQRLVRKTRNIRGAQQTMKQFEAHGKNIEMRLTQEEPLLAKPINANVPLPVLVEQVCTIIGGAKPAPPRAAPSSSLLAKMKEREDAWEREEREAQGQTAAQE